ncbi:MAG: metallophosphoesterase [Lachnospira sp.]
MRKTRKLVSAVLAASMVAGIGMGSVETYARSSMRAAWNDASSSKTTGTAVKDACYVEDGSETAEKAAYSNVYADSAEWAAWQEKWKTIRNNYEQIALTPGENATKMNFAWYCVTEEIPKIKLMDSQGRVIQEVQGQQNLANKETITENDNVITLIPNKVTVSGLAENTSYQYQYYLDGAWSDTYTFETKSTENFSVMYVGDPQIGASVGQDDNSKEYHAMNDAYNWNHTLSSALSAHSNVSFILSAGDQINQTSVSKDADKLEQQIEYAGFLSSPLLRSMPVATTIGNHDSKSVNYSNHFNNPNTATSVATTEGKTDAGTDYYFTYGNTLFVSIDTNNYNCATHENVIKEAVEANPDATWRVLMFHQDIYGSGYDHSDSDGIVLRTQLTPIIDKYDFDAVLQGHDHTYSRTYQLSSDGQTHSSYQSAPKTNTDDFSAYLGDNACYNILTNIENKNNVVNPEGTVYFEANSATGSKYYQLIGTQQNYIAARSQSWRPTYSVIDFTETTLTVKTYDAATNTELVADGNIKTSYTIVKSVEKEDLKKEIESAEVKLGEVKAAGTYTEESVQKLSDTIDAAKAIYENAESTTTDVASAVTSLQEAVSALKAVDNGENGNDTDNNISSGDSTSDGNNAGNAGTADDNAGTSGNGQTSGNSTTQTGTATTAKSNVQTGDNAFPTVLWFSLGAASLAGLGYIAVTEKKRKNEN